MTTPSAINDGPLVRADAVTWDHEHDVVVVGAGAGGFATALNLHRLGTDVVVLEKADTVGGTMQKSAAWYWMPNNSYMQADDKVEDKSAAMRYMARLVRPQAYDPHHARYGLDAWEYTMIAAFFDNAAAANDALAELGAITPIYAPDVPDYHSYLPQNAMPYGRTLFPQTPGGEVGKGPEMRRGFLAKATALGIPIHCGYPVTSAVIDADGTVVGVITQHEGRNVAFRGRQGVVFASGGFTHNIELRHNHLQAPIMGGCAALTNTGDFVPVTVALGAPLRNMNFAWMAPLPLEIALSGSPYTSGLFAVPGDSMLWVDKHGRRVVNEKASYNELAMSFFEYDPQTMEYPQLLRFMIWDQRSMDAWRATEAIEDTTPPRLALDNYGNIMYDGFHVIQGATLGELAAAIEKRLESLAPYTGGFALAPEFADELPDSIRRFNELARSGKDVDFGRGDKPIEHTFNGPAREGNDCPNPTMYPISDSGPYYCTIVCAGSLDTKGGPRTNVHGQVLDVSGQPIPGLYGVGNCVASPSGQGYWAGGGTLGPIITFGYLAATHLARQPRRS